MNALERLKVLINSSTPIVVMETVEEVRALTLVSAACSELNMALFEWTVADGLTRSGSKTSVAPVADLQTRINAARAAVGDSGEEQRLIKTLPRKGIRFVGSVREDGTLLESATTMPAAIAQPAGSPVAPKPSVHAENIVAAPSFGIPDRPSIAVLPFTNISGDPDQDYFADGMAEEILTALSRCKSLFVIARNSSFTYRGKSVDVRQVGCDLGVRYVLEGSVRRGANRLRFIAQLIDATSGAHIIEIASEPALHV